MANEPTDDELPVVAPLPVAPSSASREIMRSYADRLAMVLRVNVGLAEAAANEMIAGLYAGRAELFIHAAFRLRDANENVRKATNEHREIFETMALLDRAYGDALAEVSNDLIRKDVARDLRGLDVLALGIRYASHKIQCKDPKCGETRAYLAEFKRRGIETPKIDGGP